jgi:hypothetical protein
MKQENNNNNDWITNLACNALFFVVQLAVGALFAWLEGKSSTEVRVKRHIRGDKIIKEHTRRWP